MHLRAWLPLLLLFSTCLRKLDTKHSGQNLSHTSSKHHHTNITGEPPTLWVEELVRRSSHQPPFLSHCGAPPDAPCMGLVSITSRLKAHARRQVIRDTWLSMLPVPGLDFVFVVGSPASGSTPELDQHGQHPLVREFETFRDLAVLQPQEQALLPAHMLHMWKWVVRVARGRYPFLVKAEDDDVVNPFQLRLLLARLPGEGRPVFWGRKLHYSTRRLRRDCMTGKTAGALYVLSRGLAERMLNLSYDSFFKPTKDCMSTVDCSSCSDDVVSAFIHSLFPNHLWINAQPCQVYNDPKLPDFGRHFNSSHAMWKCGPDYSNQTVAVHRVKDDERMLLVFQSIEPYVMAMQADCQLDWGATNVGLPSASCRRWHDFDWSGQGQGPPREGAPPRYRDLLGGGKGCPP